MWITALSAAVPRWRVIGCDLLACLGIAARIFVVAENELYTLAYSFLGCCVERRSRVEAREVVNSGF